MDHQPQEKRNNEKLYLAIIAALVVICSVLTWKIYDYRSSYEYVSVQRAQAEEEKDKLKSELEDMLRQYDKLHTDNRKVTEEMRQQKEQIRDLLEQVEKNKGNLVLIARYKKEVGTLRTVMKSYVHTIDSLNTLNQQLSSENIQVKEELGAERDRSRSLESQTQEMSGIIAKAAVLKASVSSFSGIRLRNSGGQVETDRAANTEIFKACFQIAENTTAKPGPRTIYVRILKPDGSVIYTEPGFAKFEGIDGNYSARKEIDYNNKAEDLCIYANSQKGLLPGKYQLQVYESGIRIGGSTITLK